MVHDEYPYNIRGFIYDNFLEENKEISKYSIIKDFIDQKGEEYVNKFLWSVYLYMDPRTFIHDKTTYNERINIIRQKYFSDFNPDQYKGIIFFYQEKILKSDDIISYIRLKINYEKKVLTDPKFTISKAVKELTGLIIYSKKSYGVLNMAEQMYSKKKNKYPRKIEGSPEEDSFFSKNREVMLFDKLDRFMLEHEPEEASKIMWSLFYVLDPKSFYHDKMTRDEREIRCKEKYFNIDFLEYIEIEEFYKGTLLLDEDQVNYNNLRDKMNFLMMTSNGKYDTLMASQDKEQLNIYRQKVFNDSDGYKTIRVAGKKQAGLLASRVIQK